MNLIESAVKCATELDNVLGEMARAYDIEMGEIRIIAYQNAVERGITTAEALGEISEKLKRHEKVIS